MLANWRCQEAIETAFILKSRTPRCPAPVLQITHRVVFPIIKKRRF